MDRIVWRKVETKENAEREHTAKSSRKGDISNPQPATPRGASWHVGTRVSRKDLAPDLSGRQIFEDFWHFHGQANFESNFRKSTPGPKRASVLTALFHEFDNRYQIYEDAEDMAIFFD